MFVLLAVNTHLRHGKNDSIHECSSALNKWSVKHIISSLYLFNDRGTETTHGPASSMATAMGGNKDGESAFIDLLMPSVATSA